MPLAKHLVGLGYRVKGSKTTAEASQALANDGIEGHQLELNPQLNCTTSDALFDCDVLIINIPPKRREDVETFHWEQMLALNEAVNNSRIKQVVFVSSTSVYPSINRTVTEQDDLEPDKPSGRILKRIEQLWLNHDKVASTCIRFGGLIGGQRLPGRFLAGGRQLKNGEAPVNLIHLDDCIGIITAIIQQNKWGEVFNACAPKHPLRKDLYTAAAKRLGLEPPEFDESSTAIWKTVDASKVVRELGYEWVFDDPLGFQ